MYRKITEYINLQEKNDFKYCLGYIKLKFHIEYIFGKYWHWITMVDFAGYAGKVIRLLFFVIITLIIITIIPHFLWVSEFLT